MCHHCAWRRPRRPDPVRARGGRSRGRLPPTRASSSCCSGRSGRPRNMTFNPAPERGLSSVGRKPSSGRDTVDRERTPESDLGPQESPGRASDLAHRGTCRVWRIEERRAPGIEERALGMVGRATQRHHLDGSAWRRRARRTRSRGCCTGCLRETASPAPLSQCAPKKRRGGRRLVGRPNPSHELGAAVEAFSGVPRPDRPIPAIDL